MSEIFTLCSSYLGIIINSSPHVMTTYTSLALLSLVLYKLVLPSKLIASCLQIFVVAFYLYFYNLALGIEILLLNLILIYFLQLTNLEHLLLQLGAIAGLSLFLLEDTLMMVLMLQTISIISVFFIREWSYFMSIAISDICLFAGISYSFTAVNTGTSLSGTVGMVEMGYMLIIISMLLKLGIGWFYLQLHHVYTTNFLSRVFVGICLSYPAYLFVLSKYLPLISSLHCDVLLTAMLLSVLVLNLLLFTYRELILASWLLHSSWMIVGFKNAYVMHYLYLYLLLVLPLMLNARMSIPLKQGCVLLLSSLPPSPLFVSQILIIGSMLQQENIYLLALVILVNIVAVVAYVRLYLATKNLSNTDLSTSGLNLQAHKLLPTVISR